MNPKTILGCAVAATLSAGTVLAGEVTYSKDIAPIFQENCIGCHRPGQIGPMPLTSFEEARPWAKSIKKYVGQRKMPPYSADPISLPMKNDISLTDAEIELVLAWVDGGAKQGDPADLPAPRVFESYEGGWQLGKPDIELNMEVPFTVKAGGSNLYQCFPVALGLENDVWIKGVEFQPDNSEVVHHYILFEDFGGKFKDFDAATPEPGCECEAMEKVLIGTNLLTMWAPGNVQPLSPVGVGRRVKAGSNLVLQVHYANTSGIDQMDQSRFALHLAQPTETIMKEMRGQLVVQPNLNIKAGDPNSKHEARYTTNQDITLYSSGVHMHLRGKSMGMWAVRPDSTEEVPIVWVPNYDFNWQLTYEFMEPWQAPAGTQFIMRSVHDNSADNPNNPDPTKDIKWGLYSDDEMAFSGYSYTVNDEALNITPWVPGAAGHAESD